MGWLWRFRRPEKPQGVRVRLTNGDTVTPIHEQYIGVVRGFRQWVYLLPAPVATLEFERVEVDVLPARTNIDVI